MSRRRWKSATTASARLSPLELGTIDSAYRLVYETEIQDTAGTSYRNNVGLSGSNLRGSQSSGNGCRQTRPAARQDRQSLRQPHPNDHLGSEIQLR